MSIKVSQVLPPLPAGGGESVGTIAVERAEDGIRVVTAAPGVGVAAALSRDEALAVLLAAADSLGMVVLDPRDAARRRAAALKRGR